MNKHLPALLAAALVLPALAAPPQVKIQSFTAKYCPKPSPDTGCSEFIVSRPVFPDAAQNAFIDKLLRPMSAADGLKTLTKAAALRELKKRVNENRDDEGYPRHQYIVEADLEGYTPNYYVLSTTDYEFSGGAHGAGDGRDYVIPRSGKPVPLKLADILLPGKKAAFAALHRQGMLDYYLKKAAKPGRNSKQTSTTKTVPTTLPTNIWKTGPSTKTPFPTPTTTTPSAATWTPRPSPSPPTNSKASSNPKSCAR